MKRIRFKREHWTATAALVFVISVVGACGKAKKESQVLGVYGDNQEFTRYEVQCDPPPPPPNPSGGSAIDPMSIPLPQPLPTTDFPIDVQTCDALNGQPPHFYDRTMAGLVAVVDCNAKLVRFRTRDWQVSETSGIDPMGNIDANVLLITRLVSDADGNENCWIRLLGHVTGNANCAGGPTSALLDFKVAWKFDEIPPEVMEPPAPGLADLRSGKHCNIRPGNCFFSNTASMGCAGYR